MTAPSIEFGGASRFPEMRTLADLLWRAVRRFPDKVRPWRLLSSLLLRLGEKTKLLPCLDEALERFPEDLELRAIGVSAELRFGDLDRAVDSARRLWESASDDRLSGKALLAALKAARLWEEWYSVADKMAWLESEPRFLLDILARRILLTDGDSADLLACCEALLSATPGHTHATYYKAIALARLGRGAEASATLALDRYVRVADLRIPSGYACAAEFNTALAHEIRANPTLTPDPRLNSTVEGLQTTQLRQPGDVAVAALIAEFETAVRDYVARLVEAGDPLAASIPNAAEIEAWAVIYGAEGRQKPHLHPSGWLSGVYYVAAPKASGIDAYSGALKIGPVGQVCPDPPPWGVREIEPVPGRLVLFPSYTPHATEPSGAPGERIIVAFDVVPRRVAPQAAAAFDSIGMGEATE